MHRLKQSLLMGSVLLIASLTIAVVPVASPVFAATTATHSAANVSNTNNADDPNTTIDCNTPPTHESCWWAGNEAIGGGTDSPFRQVAVDFKVPSLAGNSGVGVTFWAGLGGDQNYAGSSYAGLRAGIDSYIDSSGGQYNYAWYDFYSSSGETLNRLHFNNGLNTGDRITVKVESNLDESGFVGFFITNEATGESHSATLSGHFSDGHTGECMGERNNSDETPGGRSTANSGVPAPVADFGTEWLNNCKVSTDHSTMPVGPEGWATNWYHIVNKGDGVLVGIGGVDGNGSFTLNWKWNV